MNNLFKFKPRKVKTKSAVETGVVYLVGAGPGDPELITVKALKLLRRADAVVYDRLVNPELLEEVSNQAERIYVGKRSGQHSLPQAEICELVVKFAQQGKRVVRLKGGDPFVFGRGGEEIDRLRAAGVPCEVIPGVTAALGCAAETQIPLTHRDFAHAVTFITAHRRNDELSINWDLLMQEESTVVLYMGLSQLGDITRELLRRGCDAERPIAVIANGTQTDQQLVISDVSNIAAEVARARLPSPALIVLGDVVNANSYATLLQAESLPLEAHVIG